MEVFLAKFFYTSAKHKIKKKFLELRKGDRTVNAYAIEFVRLSHFALTLVADEEERAHLSEEGLRHHLREHLASYNYKTYLKVFKAICRLEQVFKEGRSMTFKRCLDKEQALQPKVFH